MAKPETYCPACDHYYEEPLNRCTECKGRLIPWKETYRKHGLHGSKQQGVNLLLIGHALQLAAMVVMLPLFLFVGITQLVYVVPGVLWFAFNGHTEAVKGLLLGGGITFVLNVGLFSLLCGRIV
ncbi:MAG: hypothetical protein P1V36_13745 [Planctomycetota bacterium]|nr:hypothetical protein [Planctomycetota bacterium]